MKIKSLAVLAAASLLSACAGVPVQGGVSASYAGATIRADYDGKTIRGNLDLGNLGSLFRRPAAELPSLGGLSK